MKKLSPLLIVLTLPVLAFAGDINRTAAMSDLEPTQMNEGNKFNWYVVAVNEYKGINKIRKFHEMCNSGVQQIDYVVNCTNNTMAMADFAVLTPQGRQPLMASTATVDMLSFYKPVIDHDVKIADSVCGKQFVILKAVVIP